MNTKCSKRTVFDYVCGSFKDNYSKLIPLFTKYFVYGVKALDFQGWCKVMELIKTSIHLTPQGLVQIVRIKAGMNRLRKLDS